MGPSQTLYVVQKSFLVYYSEYFRAALSGTWKEVQDNCFVLENVDIPVFNLFVDWMYTHTLPRKNVHDWCHLAEFNAAHEGHLNDFVDLVKIKLYHFADRFLVKELQTAMNWDIVNDNSNGYGFSWPTITYAFNNLRSEDPLLDYYVHVQCRYWGRTREESPEQKQFQELPHDFLVRYMFKMGETSDGSTVPDIEPCDYHGHKPGDENYGTGFCTNVPKYKD